MTDWLRLHQIGLKPKTNPSFASILIARRTPRTTRRYDPIVLSTAIERRVLCIELNALCCTDHAVLMCKFASQCMSRMKVIYAELAEELGEDTAGLAQRVGLHSGPVTAGVLRGQRSRFQVSVRLIC